MKVKRAWGATVANQNRRNLNYLLLQSMESIVGIFYSLEPTSLFYKRFRTRRDQSLVDPGKVAHLNVMLRWHT